MVKGEFPSEIINNILINAQQSVVLPDCGMRLLLPIQPNLLRAVLPQGAEARQARRQPRSDYAQNHLAKVSVHPLYHPADDRPYHLLLLLEQLLAEYLPQLQPHRTTLHRQLHHAALHRCQGGQEVQATPSRRHHVLGGCCLYLSHRGYSR